MATVSSTSSSSTSQIVDQLIYIDGAGIRKNESKIKDIESKKKLIQDINTKILDLQTATKDFHKALTDASKTVTASKENIASITITDDSISGNLNLDVKQLAQNKILGGDKFTGPIGIEGSFEITVGDKTTKIEVTADDTINTLKKKINSDKESGVTANIVDGRLTISSKESGETEITFNDTDGILNKIGILDDSGNAKNVLQEGQNSIFSINGIEVERNSNTIDDAIEGVTIKLQDVGTVNFNVEEDTDKIVEAVEKFVEAYNSALSTINTELTKEGGLLRGDNSLSKLKSELRASLNTLGNSMFKNLSEIGLEMSSTNYGKNAKLEIKDKDKLKDALLNNKSEVLNMFFTDNNDDGKVDSGDGGILGTLNKFIDSATSNKGKFKGSLQLKIDTLDSQIKSLQSRNERLEASLEKKRAIYEKQFLYMDKMVANLNEQGSGLLSMMAFSYNSFY